MSKGHPVVLRNKGGSQSACFTGTASRAELTWQSLYSNYTSSALGVVTVPPGLLIGKDVICKQTTCILMPTERLLLLLNRVNTLQTPCLLICLTTSFPDQGSQTVPGHASLLVGSKSPYRDGGAVLGNSEGNQTENFALTLIIETWICILHVFFSFISH